MPAAPPGYVGFTVPQAVVLQSCVNAYVPAAAPGQPPPAAQPPSVKELFDKATTWVQQSQPGGAPPPPAPLPPQGFGGGFSFFEFVIQLNNLNGAKPIPAGHVIMARISTTSSRVQPCNTPPVARNSIYLEKFDATAIDFQSAITGCDSIYCFSRVCEYAIVPDPTPGAAFKPGEHADIIANPAPAQLAAFTDAITLRLTFRWDYDHCNQPKKSVLTFNAETLDPAQNGKVTWSTPGGPLTYKAP